MISRVKSYALTDSKVGNLLKASKYFLSKFIVFSFSNVADPSA